MAMKRDAKTPVKVKKPQAQKIIVEEGGVFINPKPYKVLYTEKVESVEKAKERVAELKKEYPDKSIHFYSV